MLWRTTRKDGEKVLMDFFFVKGKKNEEMETSKKELSISPDL